MLITQLLINLQSSMSLPTKLSSSTQFQLNKEYKCKITHRVHKNLRTHVHLYIRVLASYLHVYQHPKNPIGPSSYEVGSRSHRQRKIQNTEFSVFRQVSVKFVSDIRDLLWGSVSTHTPRDESSGVLNAVHLSRAITRSNLTARKTEVDVPVYCCMV